MRQKEILKFSFLVHENTPMGDIAKTALRAAMEAGDFNLAGNMVDTLVMAADLKQTAFSRSNEVAPVVSNDKPTALMMMETSSNLLADGNIRKNPMAIWKWNRFAREGASDLGLKKQSPSATARGPHVNQNMTLR